jgi:hypothetical protein
MFKHIKLGHKDPTLNFKMASLAEAGQVPIGVVTFVAVKVVDG